MSISVLNTDAGLSGKTIANLEDAQNVTGLKSFNRSPNAPFAVQAASAVVPNLIAESLSGGSVAATTGTFSSTLAVTGVITGRTYTPYTNTETGSKNNWAPTGIIVGNNYIQWSGASDLTVTGFSGGSVGQTLTFHNSGSSVARFAHASGSSTAANTFYNTVTSSSTPVAAGGHATWVHNGAVWVMVEHTQGAAITVAHSDANFSADGVDADWAVAVGDQAAFFYTVENRTIRVTLQLATTTVASTPAALNVVVPGGFSLAVTATQYVSVAYGNDNGTVRDCIAYGTGTNIYLIVVGTTWANSTDGTFIYFCGTFDIT